MHSLWVIILLAVCSVGVCHAKHLKLRKHPHHHSHRNPDSIYCFSEGDLEDSPSEVLEHFVSSKMRWDRYPAVNLVNTIEDTEKRRRRRRTTEATCPEYSALEKGQHVNERSISPWTYRIDTDENRYPQKLAFAHCLCTYCISSTTGKESSSLNSLPVKQTMLVLRKKTCPYESTLSTFVLEYISVPVACTCAAPRY